eukprot:TRINITY_DN3318_c0_g1::TRINITY_DN3318_c0_g1_i1::g.30972::m.30972 TRINITY_DN3318_c0_g1::TRINITY_DN3318_c0_g1_i1::g.30972  ORF type:complete len:151 (+),score=7.35,sp/Q9UU90/POP5_SCHPO/36.15/3e-25,RNase_P_Rpp14/PF01900.14/5.4e-31,KRAB/PF01352.22/1.9e+03,KRAB/PF01352.22/0.27 TRINITY_DN3318_c0_g1_i1:96-548(+)
MVRFKNRYLVCEFSFEEFSKEEYINNATLSSTLKDAIARYYGDYGLAAVMQGIQVKYFSPVTGLAIIRSPRDHFRQVWTCLTLITQVKGRPVSCRVFHVGGTMRSCQKVALKFSQDEFHNLIATQTALKDKNDLQEKSLLAQEKLQSLEY